MHKLTAEHLRKALDGDFIKKLCGGDTGDNHHCAHAGAISDEDNWRDFVNKAELLQARGEFMGMPPEVSVMFMGLHIGYAAALIQFGLEEAVLSEDDKTKVS